MCVGKIIFILHSLMWYSNLKPDANYIPPPPFLLTLLTAPVYALVLLTVCDSIQNMLVPCIWVGIVFCCTLLHFNHSFAVLVWPSGSTRL